MVSSGNHDGDSRNDADESVAELAAGGAGGAAACGWRRLRHGRRRGSRSVHGGTGSSRAANFEALLEREAQRVKGRWIWIHHAPPEGARTSWTGRKFAGDEFLREWIDRFQPDMVLSGHIHNSPFYDDGFMDRSHRTDLGFQSRPAARAAADHDHARSRRPDGGMEFPGGPLSPGSPDPGGLTGAGATRRRGWRCIRVSRTPSTMAR